ncbi:hypothetical protein GCM10017562_03000 [Streptomyces roseofulvus]
MNQIGTAAGRVNVFITHRCSGSQSRWIGTEAAETCDLVVCTAGRHARVRQVWCEAAAASRRVSGRRIGWLGRPWEACVCSATRRPERGPAQGQEKALVPVAFRRFPQVSRIGKPR